MSDLTAALADRYRIEREIGSGGMATVYLATDLRHERQVAVKVLRPDLSASIGSERFLQEIRIAARLSHPHILPLHDSGEAAGLLYYVMPYVPGESLRQRIAREGELPVPDAVRILRDVADALAHAHEHGVVHRDIKPENILISGRHALVADFGVAKAVSEATGRSKLTTAGVALGTPSYMAPEQAVADPHVDHRADIYALGIVGYEMITGDPPFTGGSPQQVLAAQVTEAPRPVTARRPAVPPVLADAIMRCLEKKPADRWQSAGELLSQVEAAQTPTGGSTPTNTRPIAVVRARRSPLFLSGAVILLMLVAAFVIWRRGSTSGAPAASAVSVRDRTQLTFTGHVQSPAISPDGKQLAYVTKECDETRCAYGVDVQDVGGTTTRRVLAGAASAYFIEWSPDRRNLLVTGTMLGRWGTWLVSLVGGAPRWVALGGGVAGSGAAFFAGGDSLLLTPALGVDT
nr:serine/threonine-protein kinase [Gemmatimonadales bacterium]